MAGRRGSIIAVSTVGRLFLALWVALCVIETTQADSREMYRINLPAQNVADALNGLSEQTGIPVVFPFDLVKDRKSKSVIGTYSLSDALRALLKDSGLSGGLSEKGVITISLKSPARPAGEPTVIREENDAASQNNTTKRRGIGALLASVFAFTASAQNAEIAAPESDATKLSEIIVTAQKRNERLQDVPVPVTVLDTEALAARNENRLQDYFASVPGLNLAQIGGGQQSIAIRGITTSFIANPTVGITIDDVPYGSSTLLGFGSTVVPDLDPGDLSSIEVLRGPQGTLYGASSMGGLLKYITKDPSFDGVNGRVQMFGNGVQHGDAGYGARGSINIPISDNFAIRANGIARRDSGYVDNVTTGLNGVNRVDVYGGRLAALWKPNDAFSLKVSALLQNTESEGTSFVDTDQGLQPLFGDLNQSRPHPEPWSVAIRLFTAVAKASLDFADFTSVSGFGDNIYHQNQDSTGIYGGAAQTYFSVPQASYINDFDTKKFTQEFRLSSNRQQRLEWLVGAFYTHESSAANQFAAAIEPATGAQVGQPIDFNFPTTVSEYAVFGDLTFRFTEQFDVQVGGRESMNRQVYNETDSGPLTQVYFNAPSPFANATERTNENAFTYLVTPRYRLSPDFMLYARFSSGYRVGGNNVNAVVGDVPQHFSPDKTNNYELGLKGELLERKLTFDVSAYIINWKDIQLNLFAPATGFSYNVNGGFARSQGFELSVQAKPFTGFSITAATSLSDAHLTQDFSASASAIGLSGDPLPYSSRFSGNIAVDQDFHLAGDWTGFVGTTATYIGAREGEFLSIFAAPQPRNRFPAYANFDARLGARRDLWNINLFANNVANRRGIVGGGTNIYGGTGFDAIYIQPRTIGVSITRTF